MWIRLSIDKSQQVLLINNGKVELHYRGKIPFGHSLREERSGNDKRFSEIEWEITIYPMTLLSDPCKTAGGIGGVSHHDEHESTLDGEFSPESIFAWACVEPDVMKILLARNMHDAPVRSITFEVTGDAIEYGWEPDGTGKVWDLKKAKELLVTNIAFDFSDKVEGALEDFDREIARTPTNREPVSPGLLEELRASNRRLWWTNSLLVLIALIAWFK